MYNGNSQERNTNWADLIDSWGRELLEELGYNAYWLPTDHNPITRALENGELKAAAGRRRGDELEETPIGGFLGKITDKQFNRKNLSRLATICQMVVYDAQYGPERDSEPKGLRRHWYAWYKPDFAQAISRQIWGEDPNDDRWGRNWSGRLSETYNDLVLQDDVTYHDLWVKDASRMINSIYEELFRKANIVLFVEKDSLFDDFKRAATALGAKVIVSGKGKMSFAGMEKLLRDHFSWPYREIWNGGDYPIQEPAFTADNPLIILDITDYDYDGEQVISKTPAVQASRYTPHILTARVGISPFVVQEKGYRLQDTWYEVKVKRNKAYIEWTEAKALFIGQCPYGDTHVALGTNDQCPTHHADYEAIDYFGQDLAYGFEVEAMQTSDYRSLLVDALLQVLPYELILEKLREEAHANPDDAVYTVRQEALEENEAYQTLVDEINRLNRFQTDFDQQIWDLRYGQADEHKHDFADQGDDPDVSEFVHHVERSQNGPWRPFRTWERTELLQEWLKERFEADIEELAQGEVSVANRQTGRVAYEADEFSTGLVRRDEDSEELVYLAGETDDVLDPGDDVEFTPVEGLNGLTAVNVVKIR
jgi:hypothetical protein